MQSSMMVISTVNSLFGNKTLFESGAGCKVGIVVTRSKDSATCVLSNYNGNVRPSICNHIREKRNKSSILLSQWYEISLPFYTLADLNSCARMSLSRKSIRGYQAKRHCNPKEIISTVHEEQNLIWKRNNRNADVLIAVGAHIPVYDQTIPKIIYPNLVDYRMSYDSGRLCNSIDLILASTFYLELVGPPQPNELGRFFCRIQIRCRLSPSSRAYRSLIGELRKKRARFYFDYQSIPCVNRQLYDEFKRGVAFSRCLELTTHSMNDAIDVRVDGITSTSRSISNCPYKLKQLVEDQELNCIFGSKDHKERYFGSVYEKRSQYF